MKIGKLLKTAIKFAPIIYPIVKKAMSRKKAAGTIKSKKIIRWSANIFMVCRLFCSVHYDIVWYRKE